MKRAVGVGLVLGVLGALVLGCSRPGPGPAPAPGAATGVNDAESVYGPLEVGADYADPDAGYRKLSMSPWVSQTHGNRWVVVYANEAAYQPYIQEQPMPEGAVLVKVSWEDAGGRPSETTPGPIFVMQKRAQGYDPEHDDWWYAIHWAKPTPEAAEKFGGPVYWRGRSAQATYCWRCHDNYDRSIGGIPPEHQSWPKTGPAD